MRILVVEDFQPLRISVAKALREDGYAVDEASDGNMGWLHIRQGHIDVVVLDLMLPGMDGLSILKGMMRLKDRPCVLILTARDTTEDRVAGLNAGADDYLVKPFALLELLARVKALVRRKYAMPSVVVRIADLEVDTGGRVVRRGGKTINLSAREYALLEYLVVRAGQVVTREEIWGHIYDANATLESNVVDVYVGLLRKKLDRAGLEPLIHTRRGQGYLLGAVA